MPLPKVAVVILNWRDPEATIACLTALAASDYPHIRTIVVDNASGNGSAERISRLSGVELIRNESNLGFTGGANVGMRHAMAQNCDYVWLLNSDAIVPPGALSHLVATAEADPRVGLVSPALRDPEQPHAPSFFAGRFEILSQTMEIGSDLATALRWQQENPDRIILVGTALLIRRALIEAIGYLDEQYFAYVEDVDYSLRSLDAGFRNLIDPTIVVHHPSKPATNDPSAFPAHLHYFMTRNYPLLWRKRSGSLRVNKLMWWHVQRSLRTIDRMRNDTAGIAAVKAGLWDGFLGRGGPFDAKRRAPPLADLAIKALGAARRRGIK